MPESVHPAHDDFCRRSKSVPDRVEDSMIAYIHASAGKHACMPIGRHARGLALTRAASNCRSAWQVMHMNGKLIFKLLSSIARCRRFE